MKKCVVFFSLLLLTLLIAILTENREATAAGAEVAIAEHTAELSDVNSGIPGR